jgi:hypothetical protein
MKNIMTEAENRQKFRSKLTQGFDLTYQRLLAFKRYKKTPLVIIKKSKIVEISPDEFEAQLKDLKNVKPYQRTQKLELVKEPLEKLQKRKKK